MVSATAQGAEGGVSSAVELTADNLSTGRPTGNQGNAGRRPEVGKITYTPSGPRVNPPSIELVVNKAKIHNQD